MEPMETKEFRFEIKSIDEKGWFSGYASTFGNVDRVKELVAPGAFTKSLDKFVNEGVIVWQHDWSMPIGKPTKAIQDEHGLYVEGVLSDTTAGRDARTLINDKVIQKLSIGYIVKNSIPFTKDNIKSFVSDELSEEEKTDLLRYGRVLTEIELLEFSPVSIPANESASILHSKNVPITFDTEAEIALTAINAFSKRLRGIAELRESQNRPLSTKHLDLINGLLVSFGMVEEELNALLPVSVPDIKAELLIQLKKQQVRASRYQ